MNRSERFVYHVCRKSFLSMWSYANPLGKDAGTELCDILVVCDPHIVILSVKDVELKDMAETSLGHERWQRRAIDESAKQLYGAERWLRRAVHVKRSDGKAGLPLPPKERLRVHRIAVACGGRGEVGTYQGDFGKGFVHVLTEDCFEDVLRELDTISDFVAYLTAKEALLSRMRVVVVGTEA